MANLDTRSKRASSLHVWKVYDTCLMSPIADTIDQKNRQHIAWAYSGILAAGAAADNLSTRMIFIPDLGLGMSQITGG